MGPQIQGVVSNILAMHLWLVLCLLGHNTLVNAQEGNYKFENFGNQSVLLSGNVTGSVADLGLVFHNPARLGLIENPSFTIGGKAYEWSKFYFDDVLQTENSLSSNQFGGIPATIHLAPFAPQGRTVITHVSGKLRRVP